MAATISFDFQNYFLIIFLCSLAAIYIFARFFKKPKDGFDLPPSPPSLPIIGHLYLFLSPLIHKSLQRISNKYGPLLHLRIFNYTILLVSSPTALYEIIKAHDVNMSSRGLAPFKESLTFGTSGFVMAPYGDYWKFMKKLVVMNLTGMQTQQQSRIARAVEVERLYMKLLDKSRKKESVDIHKEVKGLVSNILFKMTLGRSCLEENSEAEKVTQLSDQIFILSKKLFLAHILKEPLEKIGISLYRKETMSVSDKLDELLERIIGERKEKLDKDQGKDLLDTLLSAYRDENAEYKLTMNHIKALFAELFVGGTDTSSSTIQWIMAEIINSPNTLRKLREEIDSVVGRTRMIQETDLPKLPFLEAVFKEGLRLHGPSPLLIRKFQEGYKIRGGFYIPENTTLVVNAYAIMRDPNFWEDPDEFKPERFMGDLKPEEEARREQALRYIPFGIGRRACTGEKLSGIFVRTVIGVMVQCFDWEIKGDKVNMEEAGGRIFLGMAHPLECTPSPRALNHPLPSHLISSSST
ncbi:unnamed protein product [Brassica oleracea]|uniref:Cytochrome P450 n=1 Tax=Brassica oleracea TaxID=3712 RepID=A0A3P6AJM5_BRAOL|nr:unnamed protein product [Brassica oleracea]